LRRQLLLGTLTGDCLLGQRVELTAVARGDEHAEVLAGGAVVALGLNGQLIGCEDSHVVPSPAIKALTSLPRRAISACNSSRERFARCRSAVRMASRTRRASSKSSFTTT